MPAPEFSKKIIKINEILGGVSRGLLAGVTITSVLISAAFADVNEQAAISLADKQTLSDNNHNNVQVDDPSLDVTKPLRDAWQAARSERKSVMLVLGADWCDRCALLERYLEDDEMHQRIDERFVVLNFNVGDPDSLIKMETNSAQLPLIVMLDSGVEFGQLMTSDNLLTFLPDPHQPIYDWLENLLIYTEQPLAAM